jgi:hypothetical protein
MDSNSMQGRTSGKAYLNLVVFCLVLLRTDSLPDRHTDHTILQKDKQNATYLLVWESA